MIDHRGRRLVHPGRLNAVDHGSGGLLNIALFVGRVAIAREVVPGQQHRHERRVIGIDARVDHGHDAGAVDVELALGRGDADDLAGGLVDVPSPYRCAEIRDRGLIVQRAGDGRSRGRLDLSLQVELGVDDAQLQTQRRQKRIRQEAAGRDEEDLAGGITKAVVDRAAEQLADRLDEREAAVDANDQARPGSLRRRH